MSKRILPLLILAIITQLTGGDRGPANQLAAIAARIKWDVRFARNEDKLTEACKEAVSTHQTDLILWCIANCGSFDLERHLGEEPDPVFKARLVSAILRSSDRQVWEDPPPPSIMNLANAQAISAMWNDPSGWRAYYAPSYGGGFSPFPPETRMAATCIEAALKKYLPNEDFTLEYDDFYSWRDPGLTYGTHALDPAKEAKRIRANFWKRFVDHSSRLVIAERLDKALAADENGK